MTKKEMKKAMPKKSDEKQDKALFGKMVKKAMPKMKKACK